MVIGGWGEGAPNDVEVIDMSYAKKSCKKPADYPIQADLEGIYINGVALVCGGREPHTNECYKYDVKVRNNLN